MKIKDKQVFDVYSLEGDAEYFVNKIKYLQEEYGNVYISIEQAPYSDSVDIALIYEREETEKEKAARLKKLEREKQRKLKEKQKKEEQERKLYERLKKKFEKND